MITDAHYEQLRREGSVCSTPVLWVIGIDENGEHCAPEQRRLLKTTNSMEHDHAEVRRRSRVVRIFPNEASLIRLLGALAIERNEQWMERRYMVFRTDAGTANEHVTQVA